MNKTWKEVLRENGWVILIEYPLTIRKNDHSGFATGEATGEAAELLIDYFRDKEEDITTKNK